MKAAIMRNAKIIVDEMATPVPSEGEVLVKTLACGICGSDLHALKHGHKMVQTSIETGGSFAMDLSKDIVMGHEFCAESNIGALGSERVFIRCKVWSTDCSNFRVLKPAN